MRGIHTNILAYGKIFAQLKCQVTYKLGHFPVWVILQQYTNLINDIENSICIKFGFMIYSIRLL